MYFKRCYLLQLSLKNKYFRGTKLRWVLNFIFLPTNTQRNNFSLSTTWQQTDFSRREALSRQNMDVPFMIPFPTYILRRGIILGQKRGLPDGARKKCAIFFRLLGPKEHIYQNLKEIMQMIYIDQCTFLLSNRDVELHLWSRCPGKIYTVLCLWSGSLRKQVTTSTVTSGIPRLVCDQ